MCVNWTVNMFWEEKELASSVTELQEVQVAGPLETAIVREATLSTNAILTTSALRYGELLVSWSPSLMPPDPDRSDESLCTAMYHLINKQGMINLTTGVFCSYYCGQRKGHSCKPVLFFLLSSIQLPSSYWSLYLPTRLVWPLLQ